MAHRSAAPWVIRFSQVSGVGLNSMALRTRRFSFACLLALCGLPIFPLPAFSQTSTQCVEVASLWLPSETARIKVVSKWNKDVRFGIPIQRTQASLKQSKPS